MKLDDLPPSQRRIVLADLLARLIRAKLAEATRLESAVHDALDAWQRARDEAQDLTDTFRAVAASIEPAREKEDAERSEYHRRRVA